MRGEKRYWLHVAIDRFTGEIFDQQLEAGTNSSRASYSVISYSDASRVICYSVITISWDLEASSKTLIIGNPETLKLDQGRFLSFRINEFFQLVSILAFRLFGGDILRELGPLTSDLWLSSKQ